MSRYDMTAEHDEIDESGTWLSIGDLMSGLLMIFALLLMVTLTQLSKQLQEDKESRIMIIKALTDAMNEQGIRAEIDPVTGDVSIMDSVLFDVRDSKLKPEGDAFLERFVPVYAGVIFSADSIDQQITRVVIEGHTSSEGEYLYNMQLSLARSQSVLNKIGTMAFADQDRFLTKLMAAGRGEIDAAPDRVDPADRKVLFRFQFRGDMEKFVSLLGAGTHE